MFNFCYDITTDIDQAINNNELDNEFKLLKEKQNCLCISGGDKEKALVQERLIKYQQYMPEVVEAFSISRYTQKMTTIRKIQKMTCDNFNLHTDRASWRTKTGAKAWFCMNWSKSGVSDFVRETVKNINLKENKKDPLINQNKIIHRSLSSDFPKQKEYNQKSNLSDINSTDKPETQNLQSQNIYESNDTIDKLFPENILYLFSCDGFDSLDFAN